MGGRRGGRGKEHYTAILINRSEDTDNESEHLESVLSIPHEPRVAFKLRKPYGNLAHHVSHKRSLARYFS